MDRHIGETLKDTRIKQGFTLRDVSMTLRIPEDYLSAIESLEIHRLPSIGYVLGYVRAYAKHLNIDPELAVTSYKSDSQIPTNKGLRNQPHFVPKRNIRLPHGFIAATLAVSLAAGLTFWYSFDTEQKGTTTPTASASVQSNPTQPPASEAYADSITIKAVAPSWIQITDRSGSEIISRILVPGETWLADINAELAISARDAGAIEVLFEGRSQGILGPKGQPVRNVLISDLIVEHNISQ